MATEHGEPVGGIETYLRAVTPALQNANHELGWLLSQPGTGVANSSPVWNAINGLDGPADWRPDVVYLHGLENPAWEIALAERFPTVLFAHGYHGTCVSLTKTYSSPVPRPCDRTYGIGCLAHYYPHRCGGLNPLTMLRLYRQEGRRQGAFPHYKAVLTASQYVARNLAMAGVAGAEVLPLFPTGSTADSDPPTPRPFSGRVLFTGRITRLKGWSQLAEAVPLASAKLGRPLTLVVAGDGPDRVAFEAATRGPTKFLGWVDAKQREAEMRSADVLAVPSVWPEPFGLVGIEAGCVGLPAAGFAVGGIPDWLTPGRSGESAPGDPPTAAGLADALVRVLMDPDHWQRLRIGAWETARRFTVEAHLAKLLPILERAAGGRLA